MDLSLAFVKLEHLLWYHFKHSEHSIASVITFFFTFPTWEFYAIGIPTHKILNVNN